MGAVTKIQWCDHTFNPWRGCTRVAAGCVHCYAEAQAKRNPGTLGIWGEHGTRIAASEAMWRQPEAWNRIAGLQAHDASTRVFCGSMCDVFEDYELPVMNARGEQLFVDPDQELTTCPPGRQATLQDLRRRLFRRTIAGTPYLNWLLLTKRPENIRRLIPGRSRCAPWPDCNHPACIEDHSYGNVWLGTSIACQDDVRSNVRHLLACRPLAAKLFLSVEPLIGPVDLSEAFYVGPEGGLEWCGATRQMVDWVIVGGESGPNARPCNVEWIRDIVYQCRRAMVPCFVKQLGTNCWAGSKPSDVVVRAMRDPKGGDPDEWPEDLRVRQFPRSSHEANA